MSEITPQLNTPLKRRQKKPLPQFTRVLIPALAAGSGALLALALPQVIGAEDFADYVKCGLIGLTATLTAYGVNKLAIEQGAVQAATGTRGAALVCVASILTVGAGLFAATYAGFTLGGTERLRLEAHGRALASYIETRTHETYEAARLGPAVQAIVSDLSEKETCERETSCISGQGSGGAGPVFRALSSERQRAAALSGALQAARADVSSTLERLRDLQREYQATVADEALSSKDRRLQAQALAARMGAALGELEQSAPHALVAGYAETLRRGIVVPARLQATETINRLRHSYAEQLPRVTSSIMRDQGARPAFPAKTGVTDTLSSFGHFLPIALIVAAVELVFPLTLWLYTTFALRARLEQDELQSAEGTIGWDGTRRPSARTPARTPSRDPGAA